MELVAQPLQNLEQRLTRVADLVGVSNEPDCTFCRDYGWEFTSKGVKPCRCRQVTMFVAIPNEYRELVQDFQPDAKRPKQAKALQVIKANPRGSYLLAGDFGSGKTALGWLLIRDAIVTGRNWRYCRLPDLLDEFRSYENSNGKTCIPTLTRELIQYNSDLLIVLDEVDKTNSADGASEYSVRKLLSLLDAAYQWRRQIVLLSNLSSGQLEAKYTKIDEISGLAVMRRMMAMCEELEMF